MLDVFDSRWLPALFEHEREGVRREHEVHQSELPSPTSAEHSLIGRVGQHMLRRAIQLVRGARHGGMLLIAEGTDGASDLGGLAIKYRFTEAEPARRYRTLLLQILDRVAARTSKAAVGWTDFAQAPSPEVARLEQAIFELSRLLANLAAIDGAVVLDKQLQVLGFGAEVSAELPAPEAVWRALDVDGAERVAEPVENVGTRHRAAYRFAQRHPQGLAIVISHDGGVSFVAQREGQVVFWEQSVSP
jgi:hypothetical protein